jgi:hypothetical protein
LVERRPTRRSVTEQEDVRDATSSLISPTAVGSVDFGAPEANGTIAFVASFFLREIPLRTTRHSMSEEIGIELGAGIGAELEEELVEGAMNVASGSTVAGPSAG